MQFNLPRIAISALRGGAGKTIVTLGIIKGWRNKGLTIAPFKKGPDFIDASWLREAAGRPCYNLDTFLVERKWVFHSFVHRARGTDGAIVEGNRGLYDGVDTQGSHSTASLAKLLRTPTILVVDCTKVTRTMAALVLGCQKMDSESGVQGVILNQIAGGRHATIVRSSIEQTCGIPVLGEIPKLKDFPFRERHLGLVPPQELEHVEEYLNFCTELGEKYLDLDRIWQVALSAPPLNVPEPQPQVAPKKAAPSVRVGVIRDSAFQFYYPENLEELESHGGEVVTVNALEDKMLPAVDVLYIGGGFPETHGEQLADNTTLRRSIHLAIEDGLPVYAECGGTMYLGEGLRKGKETYPMVGVLPVSFTVDEKPHGHGYTVLTSDRTTPYYERGTTVRGHEFHYSRPETLNPEGVCFGFTVERGFGFDGRRDGVCYKNVLALYTHIHALGEQRWAAAMVRQGELWREKPMAIHCS